MENSAEQEQTDLQKQFADEPEQVQHNPVQPVMSTESVHSKSNPIYLYLLIGFLILMVIGMFLLRQMDPIIPKTVNQATLSPTKVPMSPTIPVEVADMETFSHNELGFSIRYPAGWRISEGTGFVGFGPKQVEEDTLWGINYWDIEPNNPDQEKQIMDTFGKQFPDRVQTQTPVTFNGFAATKVITTTPSLADWYLESIVVEVNYKIIVISNGAIKDENLPFNRGVAPGTKFEDFYSSFRLLDL